MMATGLKRTTNWYAKMAAASDCSLVSSIVLRKRTLRSTHESYWSGTAERVVEWFATSNSYEERLCGGMQKGKGWYALPASCIMHRLSRVSGNLPVSPRPKS
jgi:hypothetical protein